MLGDAITSYEEEEEKVVEPGPQVHDSNAELAAKEESHRWTIVGMFCVVQVSYYATAFNVDAYGLTVGSSPGKNNDVLGQAMKNALSLTFLVTAEDRDAFVTTTVYVIYYCVRFEVNCIETIGSVAVTTAFDSR